MIRPSFWYKEWMDVGVTRDDANTVTRKREEVAVELLDVIKATRFNAQTIEELTQVVDHECLCLRTTINDQIAAFQKSWTATLLIELSKCLFQTIYAESYYERELQARALFSALALQRAQKTEAFEPGYHRKMRERLENGYRELQWQRSWSGSFSREKFRKFQSSYLLCACAEYVRGFDVARPVMAAAISKAINFILAGGSLALAITTVFPNTKLLQLHIGY